MTTSYKILFMAELLHDYYSNQQCLDFEVIPSPETWQLLRSRQMMCKLVGNKLIVLVKIKTDEPDTGKPFIDIQAEDKFLFYLQLNRPQFNIITNLDSDKFRQGKRYYFTNLHQNNLDGNLNLTAPILAAGGPAEYLPGDMTADVNNVVYECIRSTNESNNPPSAFWHDRGQQQYVSGADMISVKTKVEVFRVSAEAREFAITVFGFNVNTGIYDKPVAVKANKVTSDKNTDQVPVNLPELSPGRYRVIINTDEFDLFIDDTVVFKNVFGVIEIFSHFPNGSNFGFLDVDGKVKDTQAGGSLQWLRYKLHFANRLAYWQYKTPRHGVTAITDAGLTYNFNPTPAAPGDKEFFTSDKPIPLLESPWRFTVNVISLSGAEDPLAPNPDPELSGMLTRTTAEKDYYCTINLNY